MLSCSLDNNVRITKEVEWERVLNSHVRDLWTYAEGKKKGNPGSLEGKGKGRRKPETRSKRGSPKLDSRLETPGILRKQPLQDPLSGSYPDCL